MVGNEIQIATYFTSLTLKNVRCFGQQVTLSLCTREGRPAPWTLILGDNGVGKTTLLECLFWMQPALQGVPEGSGNKRSLDAPSEEEEHSAETASADGTSTENTKPKALSSNQTELDSKSKMLGPILTSEPDEVLESLIRLGPSTQALVRATLAERASLYSDGEAGEIPLGLKLEGTNEALESVEFIDDTITLENIDVYNKTNLIAYPATRRMGTLNVADREDIVEPINPFSNDKAEISELYDAEAILLRLDYASAKNQNQGPDYDRLVEVRRLLADILPGIEREDDLVIKGPQVPGRPRSKFGVHFNTRDGLVSLSALSLGYRTTLALVIDLAWRMFIHYPDSAKPLAQPAIVLVDEIDLHLHPRWQQTIKDHLLKHFPMTQFICTTHSPLMAQAAASDNLVVVREDDDGKLVIENDPVFIRGWRVDQILTSQYFGLSNTRGLDIQSRIEERAMLLTKPDRSEAEERRLTEIEEEVVNLRTEDNPEDQRAMDLIRRAAELLKGQGVSLP
ncbi:MAG TPA: AAA family ATPase [Thermoanaerobaculia bacterium]|jgi:recombinational DNA repair ATPase RecF|nr:AAA family ATPase [Thermoanaerobaculia bacterium]